MFSPVEFGPGPVMLNWAEGRTQKMFLGKDLSTDHTSHGYLPVADWLFSYQKEWLRPDIIAGLTTAAVVIPKAMAYATIAGLPVQVGL